MYECSFSNLIHSNNITALKKSVQHDLTRNKIKSPTLQNSDPRQACPSCILKVSFRKLEHELQDCMQVSSGQILCCQFIVTIFILFSLL